MNLNQDTNTNTTGEQKTDQRFKYEKDGMLALVQLVRENDKNLMAFVTLNKDGYFFNDIAIKVSTKDPDNVYFQTPSKVLKDYKTGEVLKDAQGYQRKQAYYGPATKEKRAEIDAFLTEAVSLALEAKNA